MTCWPLSLGGDEGASESVQPAMLHIETDLLSDHPGGGEAGATVPGTTAAAERPSDSPADSPAGNFHLEELHMLVTP